MGRIKNMFIRNVGNDLIDQYPDKFSLDYEKNKELINELIDIQSKTVRNKIAGFITHEIKKREKLHTRKISYDAISDKKKRKRRR